MFSVIFTMRPQFRMVHTLEEANQGVAARATVQPQGKRGRFRIVSRFEKPKKGMGSWREIDIARVGANARSCLADASLSGLFVANGHTCG